MEKQMSEEEDFKKQVMDGLEKNPHGYEIVDHESDGVMRKALKCPHCEKLTNPVYVVTPTLPCWSCGKPMKNNE
jgi:hypothetical protein